MKLHQMIQRSILHKTLKSVFFFFFNLLVVMATAAANQKQLTLIQKELMISKKKKKKKRLHGFMEHVFKIICKNCGAILMFRCGFTFVTLKQVAQI